MESKQQKGNTASFSNGSAPLLGNLNPNSVITGELFNGKGYDELSHSTELALSRTRRLGYVDGTVPTVPKDDLNYA